MMPPMLPRDHDRAPEEDPHLEPGHRDHRDQRVAQRVLEDDGGPRQALGRGRPDVLGAQDVEHAGRVVRAMLAYGDYRPWSQLVLANVERTYAMVS